MGEAERARTYDSKAPAGARPRKKGPDEAEPGQRSGNGVDDEGGRERLLHELNTARARNTTHGAAGGAAVIESVAETRGGAVVLAHTCSYSPSTS